MWVIYHKEFENHNLRDCHVVSVYDDCETAKKALKKISENLPPYITDKDNVRWVNDMEFEVGHVWLGNGWTDSYYIDYVLKNRYITYV